MGRVDFFLKNNGQILVNEINTMQMFDAGFRARTELQKNFNPGIRIDFLNRLCGSISNHLAIKRFIIFFLIKIGNVALWNNQCVCPSNFGKKLTNQI